MLLTRRTNYFIVILLFILFISTCSFAQEKFHLNKSRVTLDLGVQFPASSFMDTVKTGYGVLITFDYTPPSSPFSFSFSAGINSWKYKDSTAFMGYTYSAIPILFGISYHVPWKFFEAYLGGDVGITLTSVNAPNSSGERNFSYSGVAGIKYKISNIDLVVFDLNLRYWAISTKQLSIYWLGINAGVTFNL